MYRPYPGDYQRQVQSPTIPMPSWYPSSAAINPTSYPSQTAGMGVTRPGSSVQSTFGAAISQNNEFRSYPTFPSSSPQITMAKNSDAFTALKNKSLEELQILLSNKDAYSAFLHSLDSIRQLDALRSELLKNNVELARHNLEKESQIAELKNQCTIIRTTELATAQERFVEVQKREKEINAVYSSAALLERLKDTASKIDEESEDLHRQLLLRETELGEFIQNYRKKRVLYHKLTVTRLAAMTTMAAPG